MNAENRIVTPVESLHNCVFVLTMPHPCCQARPDDICSSHVSSSSQSHPQRTISYIVDLIDQQYKVYMGRAFLSSRKLFMLVLSLA